MIWKKENKDLRI